MQRVIALFALGLVTVGSAYAQDSPDLESGAQIRFMLLADDPDEQARATSDATPVRGRFVGLSADSLEFRSSLTSEINRVPIDRLTRFDMRRSRNAGEGAVRGLKWGAPIGGVFGLAVGAACAAQDDEWWGWHHDGCSAGEVVLVSVVMAGVGGGIGALIGAALPGERWEPVSLQALRLGVASKHGGVAWSVAFAL
jgi:hypothetical protein